MTSKNEIGFVICRDKQTGEMTRGPQSEGTPTRVDIILKCPPGSRREAFYHTHPLLAGGLGGKPRLSKTDIDVARRVGMGKSCVEVPGGELKCYAVTPRRLGRLGGRS